VSKTFLILASIAFLVMVTHADEVRMFLGSGFDYVMYIAGMYWPW
jgi:hypothetical protein